MYKGKVYPAYNQPFSAEIKFHKANYLFKLQGVKRFRRYNNDEYVKQ
jgi:hypothetical protein